MDPYSLDCRCYYTISPVECGFDGSIWREQTTSTTQSKSVRKPQYQCKALQNANPLRRRVERMLEIGPHALADESAMDREPKTL